MSNGKESFYFCEMCGKKLIKRLPNGLWHFAYGMRKQTEGDNRKMSPVNMYIHGSVKLQCLSDKCRHMNTLTYFPHTPTVTPSNDGEEETV